MSKNTIELNKVATDNSKEINWISDAISKNYLKYYEFNNFNNIQEIGSGNFGKIYRANWKNSHKCIVLKSFSNVDRVTVKETLYEFKLQRTVDFHDNIRLYGITNLEIQNKKLNSYMLVMDYADNGTLQDYLKKHFNNLNWNDKLNMALQLAYAVSIMHEEGIVHCGLHSNKVFIHQNSIKIGDFGLSKRIEKESNQKPKFCKIMYVDPKRYSLRNSHVVSPPNVKSDVYGIGVLLWVISSGCEPFNTNGEDDIGLAIEISQGLRESIVPDTPHDYVRLYTECWDSEPDKRPSMQEVVRRLTTILQKNGNQKFEKMNIKEIGTTTTTTTSNEPTINKNILSENFSMIADKIIDMINKSINEGNDNEIKIKENIIDYINNCKINLQEIYTWFLSNQDKANLIFLTGYFNYCGICIDKNIGEAFSLFFKAMEKNYNLAKYYVGLCYETGESALKSEEISFKYYEEIANENYAAGEFKIGFFYEKGKGVKKDSNMANYWYRKAASNGSLIAQFKLAMIYKNGDDLNNKDHKKAFEIFKQLAEKEYSRGISMLGYYYFNGIGTDVDKQKAFELYKKAASLGNNVAQYNLASMYESDSGIRKDINQAIYWYEISAKQGHPKAQSRLEKLKELKVGL
ncbi:hypothetical protein RclHR1_05660006 [Rhizophagus clarus]|uniref:Kinase-like domain-containing protein n=1 Tax=Rhizophagus clarus TaxID=94130 RepID=A0A2Z6RQ49_9GLOM|nr:hypothetical protein RclHR1_05660006 [Rhizophagus clarus]GES88015.1 kinase-like domain-containing protein [Rhizophagus clarus]